VLLTNTLASPSTEKLIGQFIIESKCETYRLWCGFFIWTLDAFEAVYGERALVDYDFSKLR
jgi:molybdopterin-containing oxidoreductase family iron-sulfur binding subunit